MFFKIRTSFRSTNEPGLMPKRISTPAINSLISPIKAREGMTSSDGFLVKKGLFLDWAQLEICETEEATWATSPAERIPLKSSLTLLFDVTGDSFQ